MDKQLNPTQEEHLRIKHQRVAEG